MGLEISDNISLADLCTMRLGGLARYLTTIHSKSELKEAVKWARSRGLKVLVIGSGSNLVFGESGFDGLVCLNRISGTEKVRESSKSVILKVGAGEAWDNFVKYTVDNELSGIEALSLIPGTVGAAPVQNIGAYGQDVSRTILEVEAYDANEDKFVILKNKDLGFSYRTSKLKIPIENRYLYICSVTFKLSKEQTLVRPLYESLEKFCVENHVSELSPGNIRNAVTEIRSAKLPDPKYIANSGSFFTNPAISKHQFLKLKSKYPDIKAWALADDRYKISAAWLIDSSGMGDFSLDGISFFRNQHLVVVNRSAKETNSLVRFRDKVVGEVNKQFGITLEQEPELI